MKIALKISIIIALVVSSGCQLKWVKLDGSSANEVHLEKASVACRIDRKLTALERAEAENKAEISATKDRDLKKLLKAEFTEVKNTVYREIDTCMNRKGYKR